MAYRDLITYCEDTDALMAEVAETLPDRVLYDVYGGAVGFDVAKTPTVWKGNKTLSVVRANESEVQLLKGLASISVLADVEAGGDLLAAMTTANRALYDSVHDQAPRTITLEDGSTETITPDELIGRFA